MNERSWVLAVRSARKNSWANGEYRPRDSKGRPTEPGCLCLSRDMVPTDTVCPKHGIPIRKAKIPIRLGSKKFKSNAS